MRYDENGHPVALTGARQRAEELFDVKFFHIFNMIHDIYLARLLTRTMMDLLPWLSFLMLITGWQRY